MTTAEPSIIGRSTEQAFLEHVAREGRMAGETEASVAVSAVARVLRAHMSSGVLEDVSAVLPDGFRVLIEA